MVPAGSTGHCVLESEVSDLNRSFYFILFIYCDRPCCLCLWLHVDCSWLSLSLSFRGAAWMRESWLENLWLEAPGPGAPGYKGSTLSIHSLSHPPPAPDHVIWVTVVSVLHHSTHTHTLLTSTPHVFRYGSFIYFLLQWSTPRPPSLFVMAYEPGYDTVKKKLN